MLLALAGLAVALATAAILIAALTWETIGIIRERRAVRRCLREVEANRPPQAGGPGPRDRDPDGEARP